MKKTVEVKVVVYVKVPASRKRDAGLAAMEMEGKALSEVRTALDVSNFADKLDGVELDSIEATDSLLYEEG